MCQCCVLDEHNLWCAFIVCVFAMLSECVECVQCGQCVCGQYVECVFVGCVGCKECVECVCAFLGACVFSGWPMMAHSPRQEQDPVTPTSSWKAVPRSRAPDVSLESLVGTMEQGFGAAKFLQVAKRCTLGCWVGTLCPEQPHHRRDH